MTQNSRKTLLDSNSGWTLYYVPNRTFTDDGFDISTVESLEKTGYPSLPAQVPGNFERDLFRAGIIPDLYKTDNVKVARDLEKYHMIYTRRFRFDGNAKGDNKLIFEGIDTAAEIFLNGVRVGRCENMFIEHQFDCPSLREGENELVVHILPATIAARKYEFDAGTRIHQHRTSSVYFRKAAHMYGWDIMPRIVSGGIWRSCYIVERKKDRIDDVYGVTLDVDAKKKTAALRFFVNTTLHEDNPRDYTVGITAKCGDSTFALADMTMWHNSILPEVTVRNAMLWYPRNFGQPNLYDVVVTLKYKGEVVDEYRYRMGLRTVELHRTDLSTEPDAHFYFVVNGKKIITYGTNWVPVDALHSFDKKRIDRVLPMLSDMGCNIVRCWGGNVYEDHEFFDYCDENGIMVWQDFGMACGLYPQDEDFQSRFFEEVSAVVKKLRNHVSIALWAGDNECDEAYFWGGKKLQGMTPSDNALTRKIIPEVLRLHDPSRPFLPSSPYLSDVLLESGNRWDAAEAHLWGPRDYFKGEYYLNPKACYASEIGYHGCPSPQSLEKFISPEQLWHWTREGEKLGDDGQWEKYGTWAKNDWSVHATAFNFDSPNCFEKYRIPLMANQVITLFGKEPDNLEDFARASQISQAEAKKYFVERFRYDREHKGGLIWWNLVDGWPQISDGIVDYYGAKKLAYHYVKRSQQGLCLMLCEPKDGAHTLAAVNDGAEGRISYCVRDVESGEILISGQATVAEYEVTELGAVAETAEKRFLLIEWKREDDGEKFVNHYFTNILDIDYGYYVKCMKAVGFYDEFEGFEDQPQRSEPLPYVFDF